MDERQKDTKRTIAATKAIIDGRSVEEDYASILVTLEGVVATILLVIMENDHRKAAAMLNEGLLQGVEGRLALSVAREMKRGKRP